MEGLKAGLDVSNVDPAFVVAPFVERVDHRSLVFEVASLVAGLGGRVGPPELDAHVVERFVFFDIPPEAVFDNPLPKSLKYLGLLMVKEYQLLEVVAESG